jgi:hypothetical protein
MTVVRGFSYLLMNVACWAHLTRVGTRWLSRLAQLYLYALFLSPGFIQGECTTTACCSGIMHC